MRPKLLLFDLDGTLVDSSRDLQTGINLMRADYGLSPLPLETVSGYVGDGISKLVQRSLQGHPVDLPEAVRRTAQYYQAHMTEFTTPYPGVHEGLQALRSAVFRLGLISNKLGMLCRRLLQHFGWAAWFEVVLGGGDVEKLKPDPLPILTAMGLCNTSPGQTWMIGDHVTDIEAASRAGVVSVWVSYGIGHPADAKPDYEFGGFGDLVSFLTRPP